MSENLPKLNVHVLGGFSITYGDNPISFGRNTVTKAMKLLQILIYQGDKGIAREKLLEELYGREELADVSNNLRVTVHRLKKMLVDVGLPKYDYVNIKKGIYRWDAPAETVVDARVFSRQIAKAQEADTEKEKIHLLREACLMYGGEFLPDLSGDEWVLMESYQYKKKYSDALSKVCDYLIAHGDYEEALKLCTPACEMYPFDEWQTVKIDCYIALNNYKDAMKEYENTAKMLFEELGISPSEKMMNQFQVMSSRMNYKPQAIRDVKQHLREEKDESGAYYCNLPSFRDNYRLVARIIERNGQSVFLMMCSLTNSSGQPMESGSRLDQMMEELNKTIKYCLRRGDCYTKYSASQFLILLVGTNKEDCGMIFERIKRCFCEEHKSWGKYLEYFVSSVTDINQDGSPIQFDTSESIW